jgi:hypothetical protein
MKRTPRHARTRRFENKRGDGDIKTVTVFGNKKVTATHGATRPLQSTAAGVSERLTRLQQGLLPYNPQTFE